MVELELPFPPSFNHFFSYQRGRPVLSKEARAYRAKVRQVANETEMKPEMGPIAMRIEIYPPDDRRRDCDNIQKAVIDALQHAGVFWDDSQIVWLLSLRRESRPEGAIRVTMGSGEAAAILIRNEVAGR